MKPTSWNSIPRGFFPFAPIGKVKKTRFQRNWTTFVNLAFYAAWKSPPKIVVWNRPRGIRSQGCFFLSPRLGKSKKRVFNAFGRPSSTRLFALLGKPTPKWLYETDLVEFDPKGVFSFRPDWESRKNAFSTQLDDLRQPGFLSCLEKPTQNGCIKPTSWNSIPRVFFPFAPIGKVEKTSFQRNWTTFVNPAFCAAWKSPPKTVVWNRPRGIRSQGGFFLSPRLGKSKKRVFNGIGRPSSTWLFTLLGKVHPKSLYETDLVEFDPKGVFSFRPDWERRKNAFSTHLDELRQPGFFRCLEKPTQNGCMKPTSWNSIPRVFFRLAPLGKVEKKGFKRNWTTFVNPAFCAAWKTHPKMVVWNRPRENRSQGCFFLSPRLGKSRKRVFNAIGRPSSTRLFALLGKPNPKWLYETDLVEFDPKGVFSFRPDWESRKNAFSTHLDDLREPGVFCCLEKPTQNGCMKPTSWNSIPRVFSRLAPLGKVEKTRFKRNWTTFVNLAFYAAWKSPPKIVVWKRPRGIRSQGGFFLSPRLGKSRKRVFNAIGRPSSTRLFALLGKPTPKWLYETDLVEFDPKGVFSFRPDWESRKNAFSTQLDDLRQPGFLRCLEKPTQNGCMKPTSWNSIPRVFFRFAFIGKGKKKAHPNLWYETDLVEFDPKGVFSFRADWESRKNAFSTQLDDLRHPGFLRYLKKPTQNSCMKRTSRNSIPRVFFRFAPIGKVEKTRFQQNWTTFVNPAFCAAWKSLPKMVVWNRPRGIRSQGCFFVSPRLGKSKKRVINATVRTSSTRLFALLGKAHPKWLYETDLVEFDPKGVFPFRPDWKSRENAFSTQLDGLRQPGFSR